MIPIRPLHHAASRCRDARATLEITEPRGFSDHGFIDSIDSAQEA